MIKNPRIYSSVYMTMPAQSQNLAEERRLAREKQRQRERQRARRDRHRKTRRKLFVESDTTENLVEEPAQQQSDNLCADYICCNQASAIPCPVCQKSELCFKHRVRCDDCCDFVCAEHMLGPNQEHLGMGCASVFIPEPSGRVGRSDPSIICRDCASKKKTVQE